MYVLSLSINRQAPTHSKHDCQRFKFNPLQWKMTLPAGEIYFNLLDVLKGEKYCFGLPFFTTYGNNDGNLCDAPKTMSRCQYVGFSVKNET